MLIQRSLSYPDLSKQNPVSLLDLSSKIKSETNLFGPNSRISQNFPRGFSPTIQKRPSSIVNSNGIQSMVEADVSLALENILVTVGALEDMLERITFAELCAQVSARERSHPPLLNNVRTGQEERTRALQEELEKQMTQIGDKLQTSKSLTMFLGKKIKRALESLKAFQQEQYNQPLFLQRFPVIDQKQNEIEKDLHALKSIIEYFNKFKQEISQLENRLQEAKNNIDTLPEALRPYGLLEKIGQDIKNLQESLQQSEIVGCPPHLVLSPQKMQTELKRLKGDVEGVESLISGDNSALLGAAFLTPPQGVHPFPWPNSPNTAQPHNLK